MVLKIKLRIEKPVVFISDGVGVYVDFLGKRTLKSLLRDEFLFGGIVAHINSRNEIEGLTFPEDIIKEVGGVDEDDHTDSTVG